METLVRCTVHRSPFSGGRIVVVDGLRADVHNAFAAPDNYIIAGDYCSLYAEAYLERDLGGSYQVTHLDLGGVWYEVQGNCLVRGHS